MRNLLHISNKPVYAFSDTHGSHRRLQVPEDADIIICAGDAVEDDLRGGEYDDFISWFGAFPAKWKLFVPGNHELSFSRSRYKFIVSSLRLPALLSFRMLWRTAAELLSAQFPKTPGLPMKTSRMTSTYWLRTGLLTAFWTMSWVLWTF